MNNDQHKKWLEGLKVGDEVAVDTGSYGYRDYEIRKIIRITPTRRFSLEGRSWEFDASGWERGKTSSWAPRKNIEPVTTDIKDLIRRKYVIARLEKISWTNMDLPKLEMFLALLDSDPTESAESAKQSEAEKESLKGANNP